MMDNHGIIPFVASLVVAVTLGGISYADQQEAQLVDERAVATPESTKGERWLHPNRKPWSGLSLRREQRESEGSELYDDPTHLESTGNAQPPQFEAPFLKDLAEWLSIPIPENATPGDIALAIKQALSERVTYPGTILSDEAFKECYEAIPTTRDAEIFKAYHTFIKKIEGKKIIVLNDEGKGTR